MGSSPTGKRRFNGEGSLFEDKDRRRWVGMAYVDGRRREVRPRSRVDAAAKLPYAAGPTMG